MTYPFSFKVVFYNSYDTIPPGYSLECGMGLAENYSEAAKLIEEYYGDELIRIVDLIFHEENSLIILPKKVVEGYEETHGYINSAIPCDEKGNSIDEIPIPISFPNKPSENAKIDNKVEIVDLEHSEPLPV